MNPAAVLLAAFPSLALAAGAPDANPYPEPALDDAERQRLQSGEILMRDVEAHGRAGGGEVMMLVQGNARQAWDVIVSCELALTYVAGMERCEPVGGDALDTRVHQVVDKGWWMPELDYVIRIQRAPHDWMKVRLDSGNLAALDGAWRFSPWPGTAGEKTLVAHRIQIEPQRRAPRWLVQRTLRGDLPDMMACIRGLAEASPRPPGREADLARCPGPLPDRQPDSGTQ